MLPLLLAVGCVTHHSGQAISTLAFRFEDRREIWDVLTHPSQRALRNAMAHPQPAWQSLYVPGIVEPDWLNGEVLDEDAWRLEIFYANRGFFDARFLGWEVIPRGHRKDFQRVRVVGRVEEGEPSRVRSLTVQGVEALRRGLQRGIAGHFEGSDADLSVGDVFDGDAWSDALDGIRKLLGEKSYAHAQVHGDAAVYPVEHAVDLTVAINPGPPCKFGPVTITGLKRVKGSVVEDQVTFDEGEPYSATALARTRARLYALRVFGVVDVVPDLSDSASPVVPVTITLTEARARELRAEIGRAHV